MTKDFRYLILTFFIIISANSQETRISGKITDSQNRSIDGASVLCMDTNENSLGYGFSDENGNYSLSIEKASEEIILEVSNLGFQQQRLKVPSKNNLILNFTLEEKAEFLDEVVIEEGKKIRIDQDTTTIKVASFGNKTEQTVEDILKKLPGIEVLKDGTIKAHGKPINKLLIEGEDMFDKNYKLLSKNLDAKVLDAVQIIDAFEDNPILKKLNNSDKVALNLKLKEEKTNIWFGNISLGAGVVSENRWKESMNLGLLKKKIKLFYLGDYNNLGEKATEMISENVFQNDIFGNDRYEYTAKRLYNINSNEISLFSKTQSVFNTAFLNSFSFTTKVNSKLTLRGVVYLADDKQTQNSFSETNYNLDIEPISFTENNDFKNHKTLASTEVELKYFADDKNYITNLFVLKNNPNKTDSDLLFNDDYVHQYSKVRNSTFYNHFNHTYQLAEYKALSNYIYFGNDNINEKTKISSPFLNDFLNINNSSVINQIADNKVFFAGAQSKLISKFGKIDITNSLQFEINKEQFENTFDADGTTFSEYENTTRLNQAKSSFDNIFRYNFFKKIDFTGILNFQNVSFKTDVRHNVLIINPEISINIKKTGFGNFIISYRENSTLYEINQLTSNLQLIDYRSFSRGTLFDKPLKNSVASFNYAMYNDEKRFSINSSLIYIKTHSTLTTESTITDEFNFMNYVPIKGGENYNFNFSFVNYIRKLKVASKLETIQSWNNSPFKVNSDAFSQAKSYSNILKYSATTYFKLPVNLDGGFAYNYSQSKFNGIKNSNITKEAFANFNYAISETLLAEFNNSFYFIDRSTYSFSNIIVNYNPIECKFSYRLIFNNINNEDNFKTVSLSNFTSYRSETKLVPRYLLFSVKYRF